MAPSSHWAVVVVSLSVLYLSRTSVCSEDFSTLTLFNNQLHRQGCSSLSDWEEYAADCGKLTLFLCYYCCSATSLPPGSAVTVSPFRGCYRVCG